MKIASEKASRDPGESDLESSESSGGIALRPQVFKVHSDVPRAGYDDGWNPWSDRILAVSFLIFCVINAALAFRVNINWDEYFYLSQIYSAQRCSSLESLQTIHVHLLGWLSQIPVDEADQVVAGRFVMLVCQAVSVACLYRIAREFVDRQSATLAAFAYLASGFVLAHGISFRADPLAGMLSMAMLAVLFCAPMKWWVAASAGLLGALAVLVTIKVVFFLPAVGAAFIWRWSRAGSFKVALTHFTISGIATVLAGVVLYSAHSESLADVRTTQIVPSVTILPAASYAVSAFDKVILSQDLLPRSLEVMRWLLLSPLSLFLLMLGISSTIARFWAGKRLEGAALFCLLLPLASLTFYRNAFPYFFPFIFLPAAILIALGAARLERAQIRIALSVGMVLMLVVQASILWQRDQSAQRSVARAVHIIFPHPLPYIDRNGMLPSFEKVNQFMSTWGVEGMLAKGVPTLLPIIERRQPPLLIENSPVLADALRPSNKYFGHQLHAKDKDSLKENYIQHWGPIWVAGKVLDSGSGDFTVLIAGTYTLECAGFRQVDGALKKCGSTISLRQGVHSWAGGATVLRWGNHLSRPAYLPPENPIYYGF